MGSRTVKESQISVVRFEMIVISLLRNRKVLVALRMQRYLAAWPHGAWISAPSRALENPPRGRRIGYMATALQQCDLYE